MTYAMTFDNSWEIMTEDEMYDVNGGFWRWNTYTGFDAGIKISNIMASVFGWGSIVKFSIASAIVKASTVVAAVFAIASLTLAGFGSLMMHINGQALGDAIGFTILDGGFQARSFGFFGLSINGVRRL